MSDSGSPIFSVKGVDGTMDLFGDRLELRRRGVLTKINRGSTSAKTYLISEISDIKVTTPPMPGVRGYATIQMAGDHSSTASRRTAVYDQDWSEPRIANQSQSQLV